jgi:hypothetical protein
MLRYRNVRISASRSPIVIHNYDNVDISEHSLTVSNTYA